MMKSLSRWDTHLENVIETYEPQSVNSVMALLREEEGKIYMLVQTPIIRMYDPSGFKEIEATENQEVVIYDFTQNKDEYFLASGNQFHDNTPGSNDYPVPMITKYRVLSTDNADFLSGKSLNYGTVPFIRIRLS